MEKDDYLRGLGAAVRRARIARSLSQEQLAHRSDLDRTYISMIERGVRNATVWNIYRVAKALGVPPSLLFMELENGAQAD